jgi:hypothetical protein
MPSVPQSLLWISLVVLWLFVLVPMLISKRDAVRRTSDVALATRVLNSGVARKLRKGPAAGHRSDPDWQPIDEGDDEFDDAAEPAEKGAVVKAASVTPAPDYLDVDVVEEDSGALPVGAGEPIAEEEPQAEAEPESVAVARADAEPEGEAEPEPVGATPEPVGATPEPVGAMEEGAADGDDTSAECEHAEDTSGLEAGEEPAMAQPVGSRRRLYESKTAAAVSARKYRFRTRVLSVMALILVATTAAALTVWPDGWWACGTAGVMTTLYLAYLRRQTRIEERVRRRRMQRRARSQMGVQNTADREYDMPSRLRRHGSVVLEIDDEDPIFEHLDYAPDSMGFHLPKAAGQ